MHLTYIHIEVTTFFVLLMHILLVFCFFSVFCCLLQKIFQNYVSKYVIALVEIKIFSSPYILLTVIFIQRLLLCVEPTTLQYSSYKLEERSRHTNGKNVWPFRKSYPPFSLPANRGNILSTALVAMWSPLEDCLIYERFRCDLGGKLKVTLIPDLGISVVI